jgi:hypothetical protein
MRRGSPQNSMPLARPSSLMVGSTLGARLVPVVTDRRLPIELQRQVQIGAGSLVFAGTLLGLLASPWFFAVPALVGAGLMTAGLTGFCGMARILMRAPWNREVYGAPARAA